MIKLQGYRIFEKIQENSHSILFRGIRELDERKVVIKILNSEYPNLRDVERLKREYYLIQSLKIPGVITALSLERCGNSSAIILEDCGGITLKSVSHTYQKNINGFLHLAMQITTILGDLHKNKIIHKDINPCNILINEQAQFLKIIDFRFSSIVEKDNGLFISPKYLEGSIEYISPEQTGRINQPIDYRTDYYSLGITFFELLCGSLPFTSSDPMEILHAHIAKQPTPPCEINPAIPEVISNIVMKLLKKDPEERYQSAFGLKSDLLKCETSLIKDGEIRPFKLGGSDAVDWLQISQKLYGRQKELNLLLSAFDNVLAGLVEMVLVSGYSGIGKTTLVKELQKTIIKKKGYFVTGKFDQFNRNIPYACLIQALRELVRQLLYEDEDRIEYWRTELIKALGPNAQIISNVIHELELLIGKQSSLIEVDPTDSQNRFNVAFLSFVKVFAKHTHPLVLFLDDLQWADIRSLEIIELLMSGTEKECLLLICSYRDNEVSSSHPLFSFIREIKKKAKSVIELFLEPLSENDICSLISDTFYYPAEEARPLAKIVADKTEGNPFFINEFIKTLYSEKIICFDSVEGKWIWDTSRILSSKITDNVVELMTAKIKKLPPSVQHILSLAACLGNQFELIGLSQINKKSLRETEHELIPAIKNGLIIKGNQNKLFQSSDPEQPDLENALLEIQYKFVHDRVQQAAYLLIEDGRKKRVHLEIGGILLSNTNIQSKEAKLFEIVHHLNYGSSLIKDNIEKTKLAELNLIAGRKAKTTSAFHSALKYLTCGTSLLSEEAWETHYQLTYSLFLELAECEHICGNTNNAENTFELLLIKANTGIDKARVYEKKIHFYSNLSKFRESYEAARKALNIFNIYLPSPNYVKPLLLREFVKVKFKLIGKDIHDVLYLPLLSKDNKIKHAVKIISAVLKSAYQIAPELCIVNAIKIVNLTITHGNSEDNAIAFLVFGGIFQGGVLGQHHTGYDYGKLAIGLNEKFNFVSQKSEVNFVFAYFSNSWKNHLKETEIYYMRALEAGLQTGDFFHAGCASCALCQNLLMRGVPLNEVYSETEKYIKLVKRFKNKEAEGGISAVRQAVVNYKGMSKSPLSFEDDGFNEKEYIEELKKFGSQHFAHFYYVNKMQSLYLWGDYIKAYEISLESEKFLKHSIGMYHMTEHYFYSSLILCSLYPNSSAVKRKSQLKQLRNNQEKFAKWAKECPVNFNHKHLLITAEITRVTGGRAEELYNKAISFARENDFLQNEAIITKLAASYHSSQGNKTTSEKLLADSFYLFAKWGASGKMAGVGLRNEQVLPLSNFI